MTYTIPPSLKAILADADRVAPGRSHASDGTIGDAAHRAEVSDHNPDPSTGIVHAVDVTNDPNAGMATWSWANVIMHRVLNGLEHRVKYLVSNDGLGDMIFDPAIGDHGWRRQASTGMEHASHLHTSILYTTAAENDVSQYFVANLPPVPPPPTCIIYNFDDEIGD